MLPLRLVIAAVFIVHGAQKLFGYIDFVGMLTSMNFPLPVLFAWLVALTEFFGGIFVLLGLLTRWASLGLSVVMLVAIFTVHLKNGFFNPMGVEFPLTMLGGTLALFLGGAGNLSVDNNLLKKKDAAQ